MMLRAVFSIFALLCAITVRSSGGSDAPPAGSRIFSGYPTHIESVKRPNAQDEGNLVILAHDTEDPDDVEESNHGSDNRGINATGSGVHHSPVQGGDTEDPDDVEESNHGSDNMGRKSSGDDAAAGEYSNNRGINATGSGAHHSPVQGDDIEDPDDVEDGGTGGEDVENVTDNCTDAGNDCPGNGTGNPGCEGNGSTTDNCTDAGNGCPGNGTGNSSSSRANKMGLASFMIAAAELLITL
uniref:Uncharacterized protein TCIL3000_9_5570 n=1 Tax=Trypanosoma congolense (strain IL3000) TaxID=1068625 RepID=G0UUT5_TRYCI|nr:unnamed protein product [Trypanosoma congolense IL3000]